VQVVYIILKKINYYYVKYQIKVFINKIITSVQKLTQLEEHFISPCLTFAQIYKLQRYEQYKIHGSVSSIPMNVDQT
jgi:hypothetical protein